MTKTAVYLRPTSSSWKEEGGLEPRTGRKNGRK